MDARDSSVHRLTFSFVWVIALIFFGLPELAKYGGYTREVWKTFWLSCSSVIPIVVVLPVIFKGSFKLRIAGAVLCIFPCLVLYIVLREHFR